MDLKSKIILIAGPTASGKSSFALKLARKIKGEIINADSMQVYKQLKVLTARPKKKELKKIKHHLYGFCDVKRKHSTGEWITLLLKKISDIRTRKKIPIATQSPGLSPPCKSTSARSLTIARDKSRYSGLNVKNRIIVTKGI